MDLTVEEYIEHLFRPGNVDEPVDEERPRPEALDYPPWYDHHKYERARKFFWRNSYSLATTMILGLVAVFAVPSILRVLVATHRSNSKYTSYKRYISTLLHAMTWFEHELKPGSVSWNSFQTVRSRHFKASMSTRKKGVGVISPRDIALTQFGFFGFGLLKPDAVGVAQMTPTDWDDYVHFWRVVGYMMGIDDSYNLCRKTVEETREACQIVLERVYTPCLENVPEYFEHSAQVLLDAVENVVPSLHAETTVYYTKYIADVPGYLMTEGERMAFREKLIQKLDGKSIDTGIQVTSLIAECAIDGLPKRAPRLLYVKDYDVLSRIPAYRAMGWVGRLKLNINHLVTYLCTTTLGRIYINFVHLTLHYLMIYFPFFAFLKFGVKQAYIDIFVEGPSDDAKPVSNEEFYRAHYRRM